MGSCRPLSCIRLPQEGQGQATDAYLFIKLLISFVLSITGLKNNLFQSVLNDMFATGLIIVLLLLVLSKRFLVALILFN